MSNHVHLILLPAETDALALALKQTHGRFASFWNAAHCSSGHVWQGRFYSCPLDEAHLWIALRYTERNPVRAHLVDQAQEWKWSSAEAHCGAAAPPAWLATEKFKKRWSASAWCAYVGRNESDSELREVRQCTHTGRPLGSRGFVGEIEAATNRNLVPLKGGRPRASKPESNQLGIDFKT